MDLVLHYLLESTEGYYLRNRLKIVNSYQQYLPAYNKRGSCNDSSEGLCKLRKGERIYPLLCILLS